jgi:hypothetical protein
MLGAASPSERSRAAPPQRFGVAGGLQIGRHDDPGPRRPWSFVLRGRTAPVAVGELGANLSGALPAPAEGWG